MRPVDQTRQGPKRDECPLGGNCLLACVASILEVPIDDIPELNEAKSWYVALAEMMDARGYDLVWIPIAGSYGGQAGFVMEPPTPTVADVAPWRAQYPIPQGYSIVSGKSPRTVGTLHACVALNGVIVHDPNPTLGENGKRMGLLDVVDYMAIIPRQGPRVRVAQYDVGADDTWVTYL